MDFLNRLAWDHQAAANNFDLADPASAGTVAVLGDLSSFHTPELEFDYTPCLDSLATPLFDFLPSPLPVPPLNSEASTSLTNTPTTATLQSPSPAPPSPDGAAPALVPGLKLPHTKPRSKPGRRPAAGASLSHTAGGRITKRPAAAAATPYVPAPSADDGDHNHDDVDAELADRRYRNNLAAKRYRQKKVDRIQELEAEVKEVTRERDDLRIALARQEAEVAALREMLNMRNPKD